MKSLFSLIIPLCLLALLSGCASGPTQAESQLLPAPQSTDSARIYVYRPSGRGFAYVPEVFVDGQAVSEIKSGNYIYIDKAPGKYEVQVAKELDSIQIVELFAGQTCYLRVADRAGVIATQVYLEKVDAAVGASEITDCKYTKITELR